MAAPSYGRGAAARATTMHNGYNRYNGYAAILWPSHPMAEPSYGRGAAPASARSRPRDMIRKLEHAQQACSTIDTLSWYGRGAAPASARRPRLRHQDTPDPLKVGCHTAGTRAPSWHLDSVSCSQTRQTHCGIEFLAQGVIENRHAPGR